MGRVTAKLWYGVQPLGLGVLATIVSVPVGVYAASIHPMAIVVAPALMGLLVAFKTGSILAEMPDDVFGDLVRARWGRLVRLWVTAGIWFAVTCAVLAIGSRWLPWEFLYEHPEARPAGAILLAITVAAIWVDKMWRAFVDEFGQRKTNLPSNGRRDKTWDTN